MNYERVETYTIQEFKIETSDLKNSALSVKQLNHFLTI